MRELPGALENLALPLLMVWGGAIWGGCPCTSRCPRRRAARWDNLLIHESFIHVPRPSWGELWSFLAGVAVPLGRKLVTFIPVAPYLPLKTVITISFQKNHELSGVRRTGNCLGFSGSRPALPCPALACLHRHKETETS